MLGDITIVKLNMADDIEGKSESAIEESTENDEDRQIQDLDHLQSNSRDSTENNESNNQKGAQTFETISAALRAHSVPIQKSVDLLSLDKEKEAAAFRAKIIKMRQESSKHAMNKKYNSQEISRNDSDYDVVSILKSIQETKSEPRESEEQALYAKVLRNRQLRLTSSDDIMDLEEDKMKAWCKERNKPSVTVDGRNPFEQQPVRIVEMQNLSTADRGVFIYCNICKRNVRTVISYEKGLSTYIAFAFCIICPLLILCAWIPFLFSDFMDVKHTCPRCGTTIGIFNRL